MKILLSVLSLIALLFVIPASSQAASNHTHTIETVSNVYYDADCHTYYIETVPDDSGGQWILEVYQQDRENKRVTDVLNAILNRHKVDIEYIYNDSTDDYELIDYTILTAK